MKSRLPLLVLGLSALSACASVPEPKGPPVASAMDRHRINVTQTSERLEIPAATGASSLDPDARDQLRLFADNYLRYGHGALVMSTPSGAANADAASVLAHQARMSLIESGVSYAAVAGATYDASGTVDAPIIVSFSRFEAEAPECDPLYTQDLGHQSNNQAWASFGCTTQANLAALVEDPADLLGSRDEDPRDGGRRETVFGHYREGAPTHAQRSDDERASVSTAVR
jgi:pilus assembly protein CpaD